jgi:outer membrane protein assembly factor BamB
MKRLLIVALFVSPLLAADWTGFRGPGGRGVSPERGLPTEWGKDSGLRWKADLPGRGLSNPVVAGGKVYVTACSAYREKRLHVLCFDEKTGRKLWERQFTATGNTACHQVSNMAAPTPVTDGKAVYALFATGDLAAIDADGTLLWYRSLVGDYPDLTNQVGMAASPALADGVLLVPMDNVGDSFFAGLDAKTGKNLWRNKRKPLLNWVTPVLFPLGGKTAALYPTETAATAVDVKTGKELWHYPLEGSSTIPSPTYADGVLYLVAGRGTVVGVKPGEGGKAEEVFRANNVQAGYPSPVVHNGKLYGLTTTHVVCVDLKSKGKAAAPGTDGGDVSLNKELWRQRVEGGFSATPVVGDGKLYVVNEKGRAFVVDISGDAPKVIARNDLNDLFQATPAVANGAIYLRSDKALYCVGK